MHFDAIIFDFDGVLIESEFEGSAALARLLTRIGHPTTSSEAVRHYTGLSGRDFINTVEARIGRTLPPEFHDSTRRSRDRALREGIAAVEGAVEFVRSLPRELPIAIASSSSTRWIRTHLKHLGLDEIFGPHVYSGTEHVAHGKPAPDLYLFAAGELGVDIRRTVIIEDSEVGVKGALASGARVIGLTAGQHCFPGHDDRLSALGVREIARNVNELTPLLELHQVSR